VEANLTCSVYLAESSIVDGGYGVFAGKDFQTGEIVVSRTFITWDFSSNASSNLILFCFIFLFPNDYTRVKEV